MELKAILNKPYTKKEKNDFIVQYQYNYEIKYTENAIEVWGDTQEELLKQAKKSKYQEALDKAYDFEQNGSVEYKNCVFEMSLSNRQNLKDTIDALVATGQESTPWNDKNDEIVELTIEDIQYIRLNLILGKIRSIWIEEYPNYLAEIELAKTKEEVESIVINYEIPIEYDMQADE